GPDGINAQELARWTQQVRELCAEFGRAVMGDQMIGQLFSHSPAGADGTWPCREICEVIESVSSDEMIKGFSMGVHNNRGAIWRGDDGAQERQLAEKYRGHARHIAFEFPFVSAALEEIAQSYEREAGWEDSRGKLRKRLQH